MASFLDQIGNTIGGAVHGVEDWIGNEIKQYSPPVQQFLGQASQQLAKLPTNPTNPIGPTIGQAGQVANGIFQDISQIPSMIGGIAQQGQKYFDPTNQGTPSNPVPNFWNTAPAQQLGNLQQGMGDVAKARINIAQPAAQQVTNFFGGQQSPVGQVAGMGTRLLLGIPESILNVPSDIVQSGTNIGTDIKNNQFSGTRAVGDIAQAALPIATIWTLGEGGSLLKSVANDGWISSVLKGMINGSGFGAGFGLLGGLSENKNAKDIQDQLTKSVPSVVAGMLTGGFLGSILGPAGKFFFGGKPGESAALSQNGLVPPEVINDAYKVLGVNPGASIDDIRAAYLDSAKVLHPDNGGTNEAMSVLNNAYEILTKNHAPTIVTQDGNVTPEWSPEMGGEVTPQQAQVAQQQTQANMSWLDKIKSILGDQSGYIRFGAKVETPEDFRTKLNQQMLDNRMYHASQQYKDDLHSNRLGAGNDALKTGKQMTDEYFKNPEAWIQKYGAMPPELATMEAPGSPQPPVVPTPTEQATPTPKILEETPQNPSGTIEYNGQKYPIDSVDGNITYIRMPDGTLRGTKNQAISTTNTEKSGQRVLSNRETRAIKQSIDRQIIQAKTIATSYDEFATKVGQVADDTIQKAGQDRNVLSALRTSLNREMYDVLGIDEKTPYKQAYAELQAAMKDTSPDSVAPLLNLLDGKVAQIDNLLTQSSPGATIKTSTQDPWTEYSPKLQKLSAQSQKLDSAIKIAKGEQKAKFQLQKDNIDKQSDDLMNDYLAKYGNGESQANAQQALSQPENEVNNPQPTSPEVQQLENTKAGLEAQIQPEVPKTLPEDHPILLVRQKVQNELDAAKQLLDENPNVDKKILRARIRNLTNQLVDSKLQEKDALVKLKSDTTDTNAQIKEQIKNIEPQIKEEQTSAQLQNTIQIRQAQDNVQKAYDILGIDKNASIEDIRKAYVEKARVAHPDMGGSPEEFSKVNQAYNTALDAYISKAKGTSPFSTEATGLNPGNVPPTTPTRPTFTGSGLPDYDPHGILTPEDKQVAERALDLGPRQYGTGRQISKLNEARIDLAKQTITRWFNRVTKDIPNPEDRTALAYALDGSTSPDSLTPELRNIYERARVLTSVFKDVGQKIHANMGEITNYFPGEVASISKDSPLFQAQALSTNGPQFLHREIRAFVPVDGSEPRIGTPSMLGLSPSGRTPNLFEDANGMQYIARDATMKEKEPLGIKYNTDAPEVLSRYFERMMTAKENNNLRDAVRGSNYTQLRSNPGQPMPVGFRKVTIPGLEKYGFQKDVARGLEMTVPQHRAEGLVADLNNLRRTINQSLVKMGLMNPVIHPGKITAQTMFANSATDPVFGPVRALGKVADAMSIVAHPEGEEYQYFKSLGSDIGSVEKTPYQKPGRGINAISGAVKAVQERVTRGTWRYDAIAKVATYKNLIENYGMDPKEAVALTDQMVGDYQNINPGIERTLQQNILMFWPWVKTELQPFLMAKKYPKSLIGGLAWTMGLTAAASFAIQQISGNKDARFDWMTGTNKLLTDAVEQLNPQALKQDIEEKKVPPIILSHLGYPMDKELVQQVLNWDPYYGKSIAKENTSPQEQAGARFAHLGNVVPSVNQGLTVVGDQNGIPKKSLGEYGLNQIEIQLPHLRGFQAAPNIPILNVSGAKPGTGMELIHVQDKVNSSLTDQEKQNLAQIKVLQAQGDSNGFATANGLMLADPKLFDAKAQIAQVEAKINGIPLNPLYDPKNKQTAMEYLKYQNMSYAEQAKYALKNPSIIELQRQMDAYRSDPKTQQYLQGVSQQTGTTYHPYTPNPLYAKDKSGKPIFSNDDVAAYNQYHQLSGADKAIWAANHPQAMEATIAMQPYEAQKLQQSWNTRPTGQTVQEFMANHPTANMTGVDQNGKIIPAYNLMDDPKYGILTPQQRWLATAYTAANYSKNTELKKQILAQNPWLKSYWELENQYYQAHPINADNNSAAGGLGIDFSGGGGSGGYGGYSSGNYMQNYLEKQALYGMLHDTIPNPKFVNLQRQKTDTVPANPLRAYYQQADNLVKLLSQIPEVSTKDLPKLKLPKIPSSSTDINIPVPQQPKVQAGSIMTRLQ